MRRTFFSTWVLVAACADPDSGGEPTPQQLAVNEQREVDLRYLRMDVEGFAAANDLAQLRNMPKRILQDIWLLDLDIRPLMINSLTQLRDLSDAEVAELPQAAQNMRRLLLFTPDNAELDDTNLEELISISSAVGIPPATALANLFNIEATDPVIPLETVADILLKNVIATHPNAQFRHGPVDADHPDGLYPVAPHSLPLTLADVVTNFEDLALRFGPVDGHPGFVGTAKGVSVVEDDFTLTTFVQANALPFKGIDLSNASVASVNSIGGQVNNLFNFTDPGWMKIEGLVENPTVEILEFTVVEDDSFIPGGNARAPLPHGNSPGWDLEPWKFERLILEMTAAGDIPAHCDDYQLATGASAFTGCIDDTGWVSLETFNGVGTPPDPSYLWDLVVELGQVRLHDQGIAEGDADIQLRLRDVPVGVPPEQLIAQAKANIETNPEILRELAGQITDSTVGSADFFYVRGIETLPSEQQGDWLFFVSEQDIAVDDDGLPVRPYSYDAPGFFADADLAQKLSTLDEVDGDTTREKVRVAPGDTLYMGDDDGQVFRIDVLDKPSRAYIRLQVTRMR